MDEETEKEIRNELIKFEILIDNRMKSGLMTLTEYHKLNECVDEIQTRLNGMMIWGKDTSQ